MKKNSFLTASKTIHAFTMVELVVVIAIISILMALLMPALRAAKEQGNAIVCMNNVRQLGFSLLAYIREENGYLPWYETALGVDGMWWDRLYKTTKFNKSIMLCPTDKKPYSLPRYSLKCSYLYNKRLGYNVAGTWIYPLRNLNAAAKPTMVPLIADGVSTDSAVGFDWNTYVLAGGNNMRHFNWAQGNVFCLDGHVERMINGKVVTSSYDWTASQ